MKKIGHPVIKNFLQFHVYGFLAGFFTRHWTTPLLFAGKSFRGRSFFLQLGLLGFYWAVFTILFGFLDYIAGLFFPDRITRIKKAAGENTIIQALLSFIGNLKNQKWLAFGLAAILFSGALLQSPLFSSNQNTYFLPGLARTGYGFLSSDWLARQRDANPVFSMLVMLINFSGNHNWFFLIFAVLAGVYAVSLLASAVAPYKDESRTSRYIPLLAVLIFLHSPWFLETLNLPQSFTEAISGIQSYLSLAVNGVAEQYILGTYLQPSAFGVFLITSLAMFLYKKERLAVFFACLAATLHTSLILHAGILVFTYIAWYMLEKQIKKAVQVGILALLLILPILIYTGFNFLVEDPAVSAAAHEIIALQRQPHHAVISVWFSPGTTMIQLGLILLGLVFSSRSRKLFVLLSIPAVISITLTLIQYFSGNLTLALLYPWRSSVWLVPVSVVTILSAAFHYLEAAAAKFLPIPCRNNIKIYILIFSTFLAAAVFYCGLEENMAVITSEKYPGRHIVYARENASPGQQYLIPPIREDFRLAAGVPVFVDRKTHPYESAAVLEWYERLQLARSFYSSSDAASGKTAFENILDEALITHVLLNTENVYLVGDMSGEIVFENFYYIVYRIDT